MYPIPANATRIRYLESTGTQYVDTGIAPGANFGFSISFSVAARPSATSALFGARTSSNVNANAYCAMMRSTGDIRLDTTSSAQYSAAFSGGDAIVYEYTKSATVVNGTSYTNGSRNVISRNFYLFAINNNGTSMFGSITQRYTAVKIYDGSNLVRDYIPVRVGTVGYLFDRVSGELFGNAADNNAGFPAECLGPDTFSQGVIPTRMMVAGVRKKEVDPYAGINAFEFYGASSFTAAVFIKSLRSGVSSTTIDWGDGTTTTATTGKYQHTYASGSHICTIPDDVYEFDSSNQTPYMANLRQILNCVSQTLARTPFRCRSSGIMTGSQRFSVPVLPAWVIDNVTGPITVELFNFTSFSGNNGDWIFPICKQLSTITIHGKTCSQMLAMPQFPYITNCMESGSTDYINTQIVCDDGVIQYDLDTYGRTGSPTASKYKVTYS